MSSYDKADLQDRMEKALEVFRRDLSGLRAGRASTALLDPVQVSAYGGAKMPIQQLAGLSAPDPRTLVVQVWDAGQVEAVAKAIRDSDLGLNPMPEGATIRITIPPLSQERREELVKLGSKYAEQARIAVRNVRRDGVDALRKDEKDSEIGKDELRKLSGEVQDLTDSFVGKIDSLLAEKEKDITSV